MAYLHKNHRLIYRYHETDYAIVGSRLPAAERTRTFRTDGRFWEKGILECKYPLIPYRLPPAPAGYKPTYIDLDGDGDPDILRTVTANGIPVQWIDDDDDMQYGDLEGDTDNDCLMIDRNKDGVYGGYGDLIIDWVGEDEDGNPAMQVVVDNIPEANRMKTGNGHYMWVVDTDKDDVFNYIDWNTFTLRCWIHNGLSDFYEDYNGKSTFMKIHSTTERVNDVRMNWENPFLFYDPDNDGLTEMAIRFCDSPKIVKENGQANSVLSGDIDWVSVSMDTDNDNAPGNEFDFDMTIHFTGPGFNYENQKISTRTCADFPKPIHSSSMPVGVSFRNCYIRIMTLLGI